MKKFQKIINQYNLAFYRAKNEFEMVKWSNSITMINRFLFFFKILKKKKYKNWIDVGSGTGKIFEIAKESKISFEKTYGIDLNQKLIKFAKSKRTLRKVKFSVKNFLNYNPKRKYELLSAIGILQNCGINYRIFLKKIFQILKNDGEFFITFKSNDWIKLKDKKFVREKDLIRHNPKLILESLDIKFTIIKHGGIDLKKKIICNSKITGDYFIYGKKK